MHRDGVRVGDGCDGESGNTDSRGQIDDGALWTPVVHTQRKNKEEGSAQGGNICTGKGHLHREGASAQGRNICTGKRDLHREETFAQGRGNVSGVYIVSGVC
jgi:hypothetical protein